MNAGDSFNIVTAAFESIPFIKINLKLYELE